MIKPEWSNVHFVKNELVYTKNKDNAGIAKANYLINLQSFRLDKKRGSVEKDKEETFS